MREQQWFLLLNTISYSRKTGGNSRVGETTRTFINPGDKNRLQIRRNGYSRCLDQSRNHGNQISTLKKKLKCKLHYFKTLQYSNY